MTGWLERTTAAGRIGHLRVSFHDRTEVLEDVLRGFDGWDFCQIQYNYVNEDVQAGTRGLEFAAERGVGVVVMEPLFGGVLACPPPDIQALWDQAGAAPVDAALRWIWNQPGVSCVLSGMGSMEQVRQNLRSAEASAPGNMTPDQLALVARVRDRYKELNPIPCTHCGYCMPCPHGVGIPDNLQLYNNALIFRGNAEGLNRNLYRDMPPARRAAACTDCGECEPQCPQSVPIRQWLPKVDEKFKAE